MLGGSSGLNFLAWNRASKSEYDSWKQFSSRDAWDFDGLLPYFKRPTTVRANQSNPFPGIAEDQRKAGFNPEFVGFDGPIQVRVYFSPYNPSLMSIRSRPTMTYTSNLCFPLSNP